MQDLDISLYEWVVVFFLNEIESGVIRGSRFELSFHVGCPFLCLFGEWIWQRQRQGDGWKSILLLKLKNCVLSEASVYSGGVERC